MRVILFSLIFFGLVNAASFDEKIANLIQQQTGTAVKIISKNDLKSSKDLKLVIIELDANKQRIPIFATKNADTIIGMSNIFFTSNDSDKNIIEDKIKELESYNENVQNIAADELIKQLKPEQFITLKSKAKNAKTVFIIADPNCGYCKEEFRNIDERLKTQNVNMIIVGILGEDSIKKAAWVVDKVKSSDSEKTKLNALKEVFSSTFKAPKNIDTTRVKETTEFLFKGGAIRGVPYIYEVK